MHDNVTKTYKHESEGTISQIDDELKAFQTNQTLATGLANENSRSICFT
jgi:hypothetical protein